VTRRIATILSPRRARLAAAFAVATALSVVLTAASAAAPAGCAGKPGSPDRSALLQYCPKEATSGSSVGGTAGGAGPTASTPASGQGHHADGNAGGTDKSQLPLTNYPSTGGINLMLLLLILLAVGVGIAYGARRWRRSRAQAS
jgi:hypothetical protein